MLLFGQNAEYLVAENKLSVRTFSKKTEKNNFGLDIFSSKYGSTTLFHAVFDAGTHQCFVV